MAFARDPHRDPHRDQARDDAKRRVLEATDIARVIGEVINLKAKGRELVGLCPFHDDRNPSMAVVPSKQIFHCFVCQTGGDVLTFVQKYHGMSFPEALQHLADRAGVELPTWEPPRRSRSAGDDHAEVAAAPLSRADVVAANKLALTFFRTILEKHPSGEAARALIARRGISPKMVDHFQLGAAPELWDGLLKTCEAKGWPMDALAAAGLLKRRDAGSRGGAGGLYDALRNRVIFPIIGETGEPIAFGARRINDADDPKYLNSPDTPAFKKSTALFGIHHAGRSIQRQRRAVIVEGYTDVIACHQAGIDNAVATLGTAFTAEHARKLAGRCDEIVLLFDGDEAGQKAAERAVEALFRARVDVKVATLAGATDAKDPDELLKRDGGAEVLRGVFDRAEHLLDFWGRRLRSKLAPLGPAARGRAVGEELDRLVALGLADLPPADTRLVMDRLARASAVPAGDLFASLKSGRSAARRAPAGDAAPDDATAGGTRSAAEHLAGLTAGGRLRAEMLACLLHVPTLAREPGASETWDSRFPDGTLRRVAAASHHAPGIRDTLDLLEGDDDARALALAMLRKLTATCGEEPEAVEAHWHDCRRRLEAEALLRNDGPTRSGDDTGRDDPARGEAGRGEAGLPSDPAARIERLRALQRSVGMNPSANPSARPTIVPGAARPRNPRPAGGP